MKQSGLDQTHRDKDGEISRKHGKTLIASLRQIYGADFAPKFQSHVTLREALDKLDEASLAKLVADLGSRK